VARAVSTDRSGTLTPEVAECAFPVSQGPIYRSFRHPRTRHASACPIYRRRVSLHVQEFTGTGGWVRFGTCGCIHHAGSAPSRAARAYEVHLQVRNATQLGPPVRSCHSRCTEPGPIGLGGAHSGRSTTSRVRGPMYRSSPHTRRVAHQGPNPSAGSSAGRRPDPQRSSAIRAAARAAPSVSTGR